MTVRMRHTRSHTANRRSHHALKEPRFYQCPDCNIPTIRHRACLSCGRYRGRVVIDVAAKLEKRQEKNKAKAKVRKDVAKKDDQNNTSVSVDRPLDAETLSKK